MHFLRIALFALTWGRPSSTVIRQDIWVRKSDVVDLIFTQDLLWSSTARSLSACAVDCMTDELCVSFTITSRQAGLRECRGHAASWLNSTDGLWAQGSKLYYLRAKRRLTETTTSADYTTAGPWLKASCTVNADCHEANSECFSGQCLCTPGYYYSLGSDGCVSSCAETDLQPDLLEYPMWYILGYNILSTQCSLADCRAHCLGNPQCRSMDFRHPTNQCSTATVTARDVPGAWTQSTAQEQLYYYQRICV